VRPSDDFLEGVPNSVLEQLNRDERDLEYRAFVDALNALRSPSGADIARLRLQLAEIVGRDRFGAPGRAAAEHALARLANG
jgi:hypothetical protein